MGVIFGLISHNDNLSINPRNRIEMRMIFIENCLPNIVMVMIRFVATVDTLR